MFFREHKSLGHNRTTMNNQRLAALSQAQRDRLAFIELRVRFLGEVRRQDLFTRFSIQAAAAAGWCRAIHRSTPRCTEPTAWEFVIATGAWN